MRKVHMTLASKTKRGGQVVTHKFCEIAAIT
jgi:hypothetical protein